MTKAIETGSFQHAVARAGVRRRARALGALAGVALLAAALAGPPRCRRRRCRQLDRHLGGEPAAGLGCGFLRPGRHPALVAQPDAPPDRAHQHRRQPLRVVLSNEYGDRPLVIGAAHVALAGEGGAIETASDHV